MKPLRLAEPRRLCMLKRDPHAADRTATPGDADFAHYVHDRLLA